MPSVAVGYLLRGADDGWLRSAERFLASYRGRSAGFVHAPYVLLKGFPDRASLEDAERLFKSAGFTSCCLDDDGFDITAYVRWASLVKADYVCALNTHSEILGDLWLGKFLSNILHNDVAMVSATGSFERLDPISGSFPKFPNIHLRSNAFCIRRTLFLQLTEGLKIASKRDAYNFESGHHSITRKLLKARHSVAVVGRDGRAYAPAWWPFSGTFRLLAQPNLLIGDNVTRHYGVASRADKQRLAATTWGAYLNEDYPLDFAR